MVDILLGILFIFLGILILLLMKDQSKNVGSRFGYSSKIYVGAFGFIVIGIAMIVHEIKK
ncbi:hypothetical protein [Flavimarina sp. Hel_I_48]|uniref:hypothetical protein n=1 Tax=Flavimarina sp. Hel_I_48 TaxID=1392488 RepID=UPI0004DF7137|nr:hypothetical protein [Flavimarina sp. Hel_I_48]